MAGKIPIVEREKLCDWLEHFTEVARKHHKAKYVYRIMPLMGGILLVKWDEIETVGASANPKTGTFTTTGGRLFVKVVSNGNRYIFKFSHDELKLQLCKTKGRKNVVLREFDNSSNSEYVWDCLEDMFSGKL